MKKKIFFILGAYYLMLGISSCVTDCGPFPDKFKIMEMDWSINEFALLETTNGFGPQISSIVNDSISYNKFAIIMVAETKTYFSLKESIFTNPLIQSAYACSPITPGTDEKIKDIEITSNQDFDENHKAGESLNDLFDVYVEDHFNGIYFDKYDLSEFLATKPNAVNLLAFQLKKPPMDELNFKFTVKYLQDGIDKDKFEFISGEVVILK